MRGKQEAIWKWSQKYCSTQTHTHSHIQHDTDECLHGAVLRPLDNHLAALWIQSLSSLGQEQVRSQIGWVMLCESFHLSKPHFPGCNLRGLNEVVPKVHYNSNNSYNHSHWIEPSEVNHDCHTAPKDWLIPLFCLWLIKHPSFIIHPSIHPSFSKLTEKLLYAKHHSRNFNKIPALKELNNNPLPKRLTL